MQNVYERLVAILTNHLRIPADLLGPDVSYRDLDLDSLALVELLAVLEDELGVHIDEEEVDWDATLAQTVALLTVKGGWA